jgi:hypothetical protein
VQGRQATQAGWQLPAGALGAPVKRQINIAFLDDARLKVFLHQVPG